MATISTISTARSQLPPAFRATGITPAGTTVFDGTQAVKGYALNAMCYSFNDAANRAAFVADEAAYCRQYGLNAALAEAIRTRNVLGLIAAGGNIYYLAKFAGILGLNVQDVGALQTGMTLEAFKEKLVRAGD
jgi:protocatechuate 4,5-dioxygenase alpha chain